METITPKTQEKTYAGFWLRFVAYLIDDIIVGLASFLISLPFIGGLVFSAIGLGKNIEEGGDSLSDATAIAASAMSMLGSIIGLIIAIITVRWLYFALMESSKTQGTLGKMILSLKVTDMEGNKISFGRATGRHFGKILSGLILNIGYILAGLTEKKQALHDIMVNCLVVRD